jgi:hypothetical protein
MGLPTPAAPVVASAASPVVPTPTAAARLEAADGAKPAGPSPAHGGAARAVPTAAARSAAQSVDARVGRPAGSSPEADSADFDANLARILRFVRTRIDGEKSTTLMRLDPPSLGNVRLRLELQHDAARLEIDTATPLAHRLLSEHLDALRRGLEASGIRLEHAEVRPAAHPADAPERAATPGLQGEQERDGGPLEHGRSEHDNGGATNPFAGSEREAGTEAHDARGAGLHGGARLADAAGGADPVPVPGSAGRLNVWA